MAIHLECAKINSRWATTIGLKWLLEKSARVRAITKRVRHGNYEVVIM